MDAKMEQLILDARRVKASDIHITEGCRSGIVCMAS